MSIRPYRQADFPAIRDIEIKSYDAVVAENQYADSWNCCSVFVLDNQKIVGFVLYSMSRNTVTIERLAVHPAWRQATIGSQLVQALLSDVKGFKRVVTFVPETNLPGQVFLRANGFKCVNSLKRKDDVEIMYFSKRLVREFR